MISAFQDHLNAEFFDILWNYSPVFLIFLGDSTLKEFY